MSKPWDKISKISNFVKGEMNRREREFSFLDDDMETWDVTLTPGGYLVTLSGTDQTLHIWMVDPNSEEGIEAMVEWMHGKSEDDWQQGGDWEEEGTEEWDYS